MPSLCVSQWPEPQRSSVACEIGFELQEWLWGKALLMVRVGNICKCEDNVRAL